MWSQLNVLLSVLLQAKNTLRFAVLSMVLLLIISSVFRVSDAIRSLKEGPMIDAEGREYKTVSLEDSSRPNPDSKTTVRVECTEVAMIIFIQADFYNNGCLVSPQELFLGEAKYWKNKQCQAVDAGDGEYVIEAGLQDCGSKLMITANNLIYSNNLILSPPGGSLGITRVTEAVVPVSCYYQRVHTVSSTVQLHPLFVSISSKFPTGSSPFSLRLKTDDWSAEKYSNTVYLSDPLRLEVLYTGLDQRKPFIDLCVATLTADSTSVPRYFFIENHGCFVDARDGGLNSVFKPRSTTNSLQFQFDAFLFQDDLRNTVFVTCEVKATRQLWKSSPTNKACNYINSSWENVDCQCCKGVCSKQTSKDDICDTLTLGPFIVIPRK